MSCPECQSERGHKISCETGNRLAMRRQQPGTVDLDALRPVSLAEVAKGPENKWNAKAQPPEMFEHWWIKQGRRLTIGSTRKEAARAAWYACAESLGVYDDQAGEPQ